MSKVTGVVKTVMDRPWKDKKFYSFRLETDDRIFNTGMSKPDRVVVGMAIAFDVMKNAKGYWDVDNKSLETVEAVKPEPVVQNFQKPEEKTKYWELKDKIVELQACRNTAVALVTAMLSKDAIKVGKKGNMYDAIKDYVDKLTAEFVNANEGLRNPEKQKPTETVENTEPEQPASDEMGEGDDWKE